MPDSNITFTPNLHLTKLPANYRVWAQIMNDNLTLVDASINGFVQFSNLRGPWTNSTHYAVGDTVVDQSTAVLWTALVDHTSAQIPTTFAEDSLAHPTYWTLANAPASQRGVWTPNTAYNVNDFVLADGMKYAMCSIQHVSGPTFSGDFALGRWAVMIDLSIVGSQVLPVLSGVADAQKFVNTNNAGTAYEIVSGTTAMDRLSGILPVAKGGTGTATATGTSGNVVLSQSPTLTGTTTLNGGAPASSVPVLNIQQTWNNALNSFTGVKFDITNLASAYPSNPLTITINGNNWFTIDQFGGCFANGALGTTGIVSAKTTTAIPAGGTQDAGFLFSSAAHFGMIFGSGAPTVVMARGSLYLRSDGTPYVNVDGAANWAPLGGSVSVGTTPPTSPNDGQLWYYNDASTGGGNLYIRYNDGDTTQWVPASTPSSGGVLQTVFFETGAVATGTTLIPFDNTIPQITEGTEFMTLAITPRSATSRLVIKVTAVIGNTVINNMGVALFQDATANALAAGHQTLTVANSNATVSFQHVMTSGTTSSTTFRVRIGGAAAGTTSFNANNGVQIYGGVLASSIIIQEVL